MSGTTGGNVIKEFVVSIKYVVDDTALNKANQDINQGFRGLSNSTTQLAGIAEGILAVGLKGFTGYLLGVGAAAGSTAAAVDMVTNKFAGLYYMQQQMSGVFKGPISDLMQIQLMSKLVGLNVNALTDDLLNVAEGIRNAPKGGLLNSITGGETDPLKALLNLAHNYKSLAGGEGGFAFRSIAKTLGFNPEDLWKLMMNLDQSSVQSALNTNQQTLNSLYGNGKGDKFGKDSVDMQRQLYLTEAQFQEVFDAFILQTLPTLTRFLSNMNTIIASPGFQKGTQEVLDFLDGILAFINKVVPLVTETPSKAWSDLKSKVIDPTISSVENTQVGKNKGDTVGSFLSPKNNIYTDYLENLYDTVMGNNVPKTPPGVQKVEDASAKWLINNLWQPMVHWVTGKTKSPNVEIDAATNLWPLFINWLHGIGTYIPFVQLKPQSNQNLQTPLEKQVQDLANQLQQQTGTTGVGATPATPPTNMPMPPNAGQPVTSAQERANIDKAVAFFMSKGMTKDQAVGITARLDAESHMNPNAVNPTSGAYGIEQALGSRKPAALATNGDLNKQLENIWNEFQTTEKRAFNLIKSSKNAPDAARAMEAYERANDPKFTEYAAGLTNFIQKQIKEAFGVPAANAEPKTSGAPINKLREHQGMPAFDGLHALGKQLINGLAPLSGMASTSHVFSPTTTVHVHGVQGPEIGSKTARALNRSQSTLYRNFYSQVT